MQISIYLNNEVLETIQARKAMNETVPQAAARFLREYMRKTKAPDDINTIEVRNLSQMIREMK